VADLVAHVIATHHRVLATLDEREPVAVDRESDLVRQWRPATVAITEALGDEVRAAKTMSGMFGEQSFASLVGRLLCSDTLLHTWDLPGPPVRTRVSLSTPSRGPRIPDAAR